MAEESSPQSRTQPIDPLRRDIRAPSTWNYLVNYILLGACALLIAMEIAESEAWRKLGTPLLLLLLAVGNLARLQAAERKQANQ